MLELAETKVGRSSGISAFFSVNSDPHVRSLDHADIISTVTDSRGHWLALTVFDQLDDLVVW